MAPHLENHEYTLQAALACDMDLVVKAFMNDSLVKGRGCREEDVKALARDMVRNTLEYLPDGWRQGV